jgi:hypothetical protein
MIVIRVLRARLEAKDETQCATSSLISTKSLNGDPSRVDTALDERHPLEIRCPDETVETLFIH